MLQDLRFGFRLFAYGLAAAVLLFAVLIASWSPVRRATSVDPMIALRVE